ncbi:MAG: MerR family transcriptional regulator [Acidimicrobiales bacterium]
MAERMRVEQLAAATGLSVDTIRYYQARGLLDPPDREGRVAWYGRGHVDRLQRIRELATRGLTLTIIGRLLRGELDHADEELAAAVSSPTPGRSSFPIEELARRSGIPLAVLSAVAREGFLTPEDDRYTDADVEAAAAGLRLLESGLPLPEILDLARRHHAAMRELAEGAVELFDVHIRHTLRASGGTPEESAEQLVDAFKTLLPATMTIVSHHFQRTLLAVALEHMERVGDSAELALVRTSTP